MLSRVSRPTWILEMRRAHGKKSAYSTKISKKAGIKMIMGLLAIISLGISL